MRIGWEKEKYEKGKEVFLINFSDDMFAKVHFSIIGFYGGYSVFVWL